MSDEYFDPFASTAEELVAMLREQAESGNLDQLTETLASLMVGRTHAHDATSMLHVGLILLDHEYLVERIPHLSVSFLPIGIGFGFTLKTGWDPRQASSDERLTITRVLVAILRSGGLEAHERDGQIQVEGQRQGIDAWDGIVAQFIDEMESTLGESADDPTDPTSKWLRPPNPEEKP